MGETQEQEINPEGIRFYLTKILSSQESEAVLLRTLLSPERERVTVGLESRRAYKHGILVLYAALCLLDINDPRQLKEFKKGLEEYLVEK